MGRSDSTVVILFVLHLVNPDSISNIPYGTPWLPGVTPEAEAGAPLSTSECGPKMKQENKTKITKQ